ncbi:S8 family serine peptidase [Glycomyces buryatensis]|uniref:Peptidase S8 n=1 Tax=Glycomyces buryatensis TaxID=2570927 RepID=A0A4S8Q8D7_9ACTN|nr:S8 family serine peptidase [Glycomyces buryatensis]THV40538.1 peptidase S8 [Glycomyces buryatensis]
MPGRSLPLAAVMAIPLMFAAPPASAAGGDGAEAVWLVELEPGVGSSALEAVGHDLDFEVRHDFERIWNGVSVSADAATARRLEDLAPVERVWTDVALSSPSSPTRPTENGNAEQAETAEPVPELAQAIQTTRADTAHDRGITGTGIRVGVIDTGIDYTHPDLGGCFGDGCRVATGTDFVGDDYDSDDPELAEPKPDTDPADCAGHGTHVAGIVGADGQVTGVAPDVSFGAYKVFGCEGATSAEVIMQALETALDDGMDVVNLSLGQSFQWPGYPTSEAADALVAEGVTVVASMGNDGQSGIYSGSAPGVASDVIGVASTDNPAQRMDAAHVEALDRKIGYNLIDYAAEPEPGSVTDPLAWLGRACEGDESASDVSGKTALIVRGECTFNEKYARAVKEGATAVVIHNNRSGPYGGTGAEDLDVPLVAITESDGEDLRDAVEAGQEPTLEFSGGTVMVDLPRGGFASDFTAFGPAPDLSFKPDLAAPGGGIWSTVPVADGSYDSMSGTSMSSPHVAGAAALLLQDRPDLEPGEVRTRLANTARPALWAEDPEQQLIEATHRQGTGVVDVVSALDAAGSMSPTGISVGDGTGPRTFEVTLASDSRRTQAYRLSHQNAVSTTGDIRDTGFEAGASKATFEPKTVTLYPGQRTTVEVTVTPDAELPDGSVFGGRIVARPEGRGENLAAAYAGYMGDYLDIEVLAHPDYPRLAVPIGEDEITGEIDYRDLEPDEKFSIADGPVPTALVYLERQVAAMEVDLENTETGEVVSWGSEEFVERSPGPDDAAAIDLAQFIEDDPDALAPGKWRTQVRVLKALGDSENPDHWEHWRSPEFTLTE